MLQIVFREFGFRTSFQIALPWSCFNEQQLAPIVYDTIGPNPGIFGDLVSERPFKSFYFDLYCLVLK